MSLVSTNNVHFYGEYYMKHIFIVNPAAGATDSCCDIIRSLDQGKLIDENDYLIHMTTRPGDATEFVARYCHEHRGDKLRFYACGGDGTLNEVASALVGRDNCSIACFSAGSGNDYVKYYGGKDVFSDMNALIEGTEVSIDAMSVNGRYAVNCTHFGFDTYVAEKMRSVRRKKIIGGKNAYTTGVVCGLVNAMKTNCKVYADGELLNPKGNILLCTVANGKYVGGSFMCAPRSDNNDGLLEVCLVHPVSRITFLSLVKDYSEGSHLDNPKFEKYLEYRQAKSVIIEFENEYAVSLDGEIFSGKRFEVNILPSAIKFVLPKGCSLEETKDKEVAAAK